MVLEQAQVHAMQETDKQQGRQWSRQLRLHAQMHGSREVLQGV